MHWEQEPITNYVKRFTTGKEPERLKKEMEELIPQIEEQGWYTIGFQDQFAIQAHPDDFDKPDVNVYHSGCGPTPSLHKDRTDNPRVEADFTEITPMFRGTVFEEILKESPIPYIRTRIFRLHKKRCFRIHRDINYKFHLPIITNTMNAWVFPDRHVNHSLHTPNTGDNYYIDTRIAHTAINGSDQYRYHICMACPLPDDEMFKLIAPYEVPLDKNNYPVIKGNPQDGHYWVLEDEEPPKKS
jgi:hypothetical protein